MKANLLRGVMAERGYTGKRLAYEIGMNENTFSSRMTGKSDFRTEEVDRICSILLITDPQKKCDIFLT